MAEIDMIVQRVMLHPEFASRFKHPVRFTGTDFVETRLTDKEQLREVSGLIPGSLHIFLERYGSMLPPDDIRSLATLPAAQSAEAQFWVGKYLQAAPSAARKEKLHRRRRWVWARREMAKPNGFFCEEEMKRREPKLFHRYVGRHLDSKVKLSAPMEGSLSGYLMQQLERECEAERSGVSLPSGGAAEDGTIAGRPLQQPTPMDEDGDDEMFGDEDEEDSSGSSGEEGGAKRRRVAQGALPDDAAARREKFLRVMRNRFVAGHEPNFNYPQLDEDSELDDVVELGRDAEDKYFEDA